MSDMSIQLAQMLPLIQERLAAGETVKFTPRGISMRPMLDGIRDQVVICPLPETVKKYDIPLFRRDDGQFVLHRIVKAGQTYTCIGDHQLVYEKGVRRDQMIGLVTGFYRKGKYYSVDAVGYRIYSRMWHWLRPFRRFTYWFNQKWRNLRWKLKQLAGK